LSTATLTVCLAVSDSSAFTAAGKTVLPRNSHTARSSCPEQKSGVLCGQKKRHEPLPAYFNISFHTVHFPFPYLMMQTVSLWNRSEAEEDRPVRLPYKDRQGRPMKIRRRKLKWEKTCL
jgi:hypothetical protein